MNIFYKLLIWIIKKLSDEPNKCEHEWTVYSTASAEVCLLVECYKCMSYGTVNDPTEDEWGNAFGAMSNPYPWKDNSRVIVVPPQKDVSSTFDWRARYNELEDIIENCSIYLELNSGEKISIKNPKTDKPKGKVKSLLLTYANRDTQAWETEKAIIELGNKITTKTGIKYPVLVSRDISSFVGYYLCLQ